MKRIVYIIVLIFISIYQLEAQNLVGVWQENTPEVAATYINSYSFFSDGTFHYNTNGFNGLNRILTIGGKYKTENNYLDFHVEYTIELVGGTLERSMTETLSDSWSIIDGKIEKIPLRNKLIEKVSFIGISNIDDNEKNILCNNIGVYWNISIKSSEFSRCLARGYKLHSRETSGYILLFL